MVDEIRGDWGGFLTEEALSRSPWNYSFRHSDSWLFTVCCLHSCIFSHRVVGITVVSKENCSAGHDVDSRFLFDTHDVNAVAAHLIAPVGLGVYGRGGYYS